MKAAELRIGNIVNFLCNDNLDERKEWYAPIVIDWYDINYLAVREEINKGLEPDKEAKVLYKPIELSEEILLKCGFICTEDSETSRVFSIGENIVTYDHLVSLTWIKHLDGKGLYPYPFYRNRAHIIKYLHQLQNLYYELTGTELKINL